MSLEIQNRLQAIYCDLANQYLDNIPLSKSQDFRILQTALDLLLNKNEIHTENQELRERLESLQGLTPDLYADPDHTELFTKTIKERISAKITEIEHLSEIDKEKYIKQQEARQKAGKQAQEYLKNIKPPAEDSEKKAMSDIAFAIQEAVRVGDEEDGFVVPMFLMYLVDVKDWAYLSRTERLCIMGRPQQIAKLIESGLTLEILFELDQAVRAQVFRNPDTVRELIERGINPLDLLSVLQHGKPYILRSLEKQLDFCEILEVFTSKEKLILELNGCKITLRELGYEKFVDGISFLKSDFLKDFSGKCEIYTINLACYSNELTDEVFKLTVNAFPYLTRLYLLECFRLTDQSINALSENCPNLEDFALSSNNSVTSASISKLAKNCNLKIVYTGATGK